MKKGMRVLSFIMCLALMMATLNLSAVKADTQNNSNVNESTVTKEADTPNEKEEVKTTRNKTTRAGGDKSAEFKMDKLTIKLDNQVTYQYSGAGSPVYTNQVYESFTHPRITFDLDWSQVNTSLDHYVGGDYFTFDICEVTGSGAFALTNFSAKKPLIENDITLGYGELLSVPNGSGGVKLVFKVTFTDEIVNKHSINGKMEGGASITGMNGGESVKVLREGEELGTVTKKHVPDRTGNPEGVKFPVPIPEVGKVVKNSDDSDNTIVWRINVSEFTEKQFQDYEGTVPDYDHLILEEMLDEHQTFYMQDYYHGGVHSSIYMPVYLYDKTGVNDGLSYTFDAPYIQLGSKAANNPMKYIDPSSQADPEAYVKANAKTWTVIKETNPDNPSTQRERLVLNFGAPGKDGLRFGDITDMTKLLEKLEFSKENAEKVLADNPGAASGASLTDDYGQTYLQKEWALFARLAADSYDYYNVVEGGVLVGPYVYSS